MELILVRHGQPERVDHDPDGANPGLTDLGRRQAEAMAAHLRVERIERVYVSPQRRAIETATPLAASLDLQPSIVPGVAEFDLGHTTYIPGEQSGPLTRKELARLQGAVTADAFRSRVFDGLKGVIDDNPGRSVAVVCHGGVISTYLADVLGTDPVDYYDSDYTAVTRVKASRRGRRSMISFNECHWLRELAANAQTNELG